MRYYDVNNNLTGYADVNYSFVVKYDSEGKRIFYANSYGEVIYGDEE